MNENDMLFEDIPHPPVDYHPVNEKPLGKPYVYEELGQMALETIFRGPKTDYTSDKPTVPTPLVDAEARVERQMESEASYDITIGTAAYGDRLSAKEIIERMEVDHAVKTPPRLRDQVGDDARMNRIVTIAHDVPLGPYTSRSEHTPKRVARTEKEVIEETVRYIETAIECETIFDAETVERAKSILDNLTFIGEKEYREAVAGIALYWKAILDRNPDLQLLALGSEITKQASEKMVKSDAYLLDNILAHFTDEELEMYAGRLMTDYTELTEEAQNIRIVFLDDWTISGEQLTNAVEDFCESHPQFSSSVEIQLVAANNERITRGFKKLFHHPSEVGEELSIPVRSYYKAHHAPRVVESRAAHITGCHSSADYDFELDMGGVAVDAKVFRRELNDEQYAILKTMPPMTNIVRPYRLEGFELTQRKRLRNRSPRHNGKVYGEA